MSAQIPRFVVVGHTNEGKSSVVSTLVADDSVEINDAPRTTKRCQEYKVMVGGEVISGGGGGQAGDDAPVVHCQGVVGQGGLCRAHGNDPAGVQ